MFGEETVNVLGVNLDIALGMGLMMQESFVFTGTVMDNLRSVSYTHLDVYKRQAHDHRKRQKPFFTPGH